MTVITWQPISAACTTLRISRGLAQSSSRLSCSARISSASLHHRHRIAAGVGDATSEHRDVGVRPAARGRRRVLDLLECEEGGDVQLHAVGRRVARCTPAVLDPFVSVIGIFTCTCSPQVAIFSACSDMPSASSEKTSNEIGRSGTRSTTSSANDS